VGAATRLAVAFAVLAAAISFVWSWLYAWPDVSYLHVLELAAYAGGFFGMLGYVLAGYLRLASWVGDGFFAEGRGRALRHLRLVGVLALIAVAGLFAAVYLRYEVVASGNRDGVQYYLVWDRWTGEVEVEARVRPSMDEVRHWETAYH
jgi:hypothetical protein